MSSFQRRKIVVFTALAMLGTCLVAALALQRFGQFNGLLDSQYPDAAQLSEKEAVAWFPNFVWQQNSSFIAQDSYPEVFQWYSERFGLGVERVGMERCSHAWGERELIGLRNESAVTVCDTPSGRMIFVQQHVSLACTWQFCR